MKEGYDDLFYKIVNLQNVSWYLPVVLFSVALVLGIYIIWRNEFVCMGYCIDWHLLTHLAKDKKLYGGKHQNLGLWGGLHSLKHLPIVAACTFTLASNRQNFGTVWIQSLQIAQKQNFRFWVAQSALVHLEGKSKQVSIWKNYISSRKEKIQRQIKQK